MNNIILSLPFWGVAINILSYQLGIYLHKKSKSDFVNPLLISIILTIGFVLLFNIEYSEYSKSSKYLTDLLTPATISLAIPLYKKVELLKKNIKAIFIGVTVGVITSFLCVLLLCVIFNLTHYDYITLIPQSITTAVGIGFIEEFNGNINLAIIGIVLTGVFGNISAKAICKLFKINNPIAKGIAIGTSAHAVGTVKAFEIGEVEGAMSSLALVVSAIITVVLAQLFVLVY